MEIKQLKGTFKEVTWIGKSKLYTIFVKEVEFGESSSDPVKIIGEHISLLRSKKDVQGVKFKNLRTVESFPRGLSKVFPRMKALEISDCSLKDLSKEDLIGLENLEIFSIISNNQLTTLPDDLFENLRKLTHISFNNNKLSFLSSNLLAGIPKDQLKLVDFSENEKIQTFYGPGGVSLDELLQIIDAECAKTNDSTTFADNDATADNSSEEVLMENDSYITINNFLVHKRSVASQSSVLAAEIQKGINAFVVTGCSDSCFENLIEFFYKDEFSSVEDFHGTLALAVKYKITRMIEHCKQKILKSMEKKDALELFKNGHDMNSSDLKTAAFMKIRENFPNDEKFPMKLVEHHEDFVKLIEIELERKNLIQEAERNAEVKKRKVMEKYLEEKSSKKVKFGELVEYF